MPRQCKKCHFPVRNELRTGDGLSLHDDVETTRVLWTDEDTNQLSDSVGERALPPFELVATGAIGKRLGSACARDVFQAVRGDPRAHPRSGHTTVLIANEMETLQELKETIERKRHRRECFFMQRIDGMEVKTAIDLEARRYVRRTDLFAIFLSCVARAIALASAVFGYMNLG